jgi:hypothetical protein
MQTINTIDKASVVTEAMLMDLPEPVQRYMAYTGIIGAPWIDTVRLTYSGQFRLAADKPWMPIHAEQVYTTDPPGFQWKARFRLFGLPLMVGQDTYKDGAGHMFGKLAGLFTIFDARGEKLLQGTMVRYLQEMMWFPTAYLNEYVTWQAVDNHAADVTYTDGNESVTGRMIFDDAGRIVNFVAERYRETQGAYTLNTWATPMTEYGRFAGLRLPSAGCGVWQLPDGDLTYINIRLTDARYNVPIPAF